MDDFKPLAAPLDAVPPTDPAPAPSKTKSARAARLAAALRDNLKRRKVAGRSMPAAKPSN